MKIFYFIFIFLVGCNDDQRSQLLITIDLQGKVLKAIVNLSGEPILINSDEKILLSKTKKGFRIGSNYSYLKFNEDMTKGYWIRDNKKDYKVPFTAKETSLNDLFKQYESKACNESLNGKWKIKLSETKYGLGHFKQIGCRVKGSILTTTGDYRYLDGYIDNNKVKLQGFDGVFSFVFDLNIKKDNFEGLMFAGKSYNTQISAIRSNDFNLQNANTMTKILDHESFKLNLVDIDKKTVNIDLKEYQDTVKIIQLFGSWCPNCLDETRFINKWLEKNKSKPVKVIALAFEDFKKKKDAIKELKKSRDKLGMKYPVILVDYDKSIKPTDLLPIDKVLAYPTTLFVNKKNQVVKVHTGFSGQATGMFFDEFVKDFNQTIDNLLTTTD